MTDSENPLVARVIVNRIWQGHFGRGLVDNANDFGTQTPPPAIPSCSIGSPANLSPAVGTSRPCTG